MQSLLVGKHTSEGVAIRLASAKHDTRVILECFVIGLNEDVERPNPQSHCKTERLYCEYLNEDTECPNYGISVNYVRASEMSVRHTPQSHRKMERLRKQKGSVACRCVSPEKAKNTKKEINAHRGSAERGLSSIMSINMFDHGHICTPLSCWKMAPSYCQGYPYQTALTVFLSNSPQG